MPAASIAAVTALAPVIAQGGTITRSGRSASTFSGTSTSFSPSPTSGSAARRGIAATKRS